MVLKAVAVLPLIASALVPLAGSAPVGATTAVGFLHLGKAPGAFSPNADGRRDVARIRYQLDRPARVTLEIRRGTRLVRTASLGSQGAGEHAWHWDGRTARGRLLGDDDYDVRLIAEAGGRTVRRSTSTELDTRLEIDASVDFGTVYPRATLVEDVVTMTLGFPTNSASEALPWEQVRVLSPAGEPVLREGLGWESTFTWSGEAGGSAVPEGTYTLEWRVRDRAGNRAHTRVPVAVSHAELARFTASSLSSAAASRVGVTRYPPSCQGCGEDLTCGDVVQPGRFGAESLSYRSDTVCESGQHLEQAYESHLDILPVAPAYDVASISWFGGPTVAGETDQGTLERRDPDTGAPVSTSSGEATDHVTTTPALRFADPGVTDTVIRWQFRTAGTDSYDVEWFRVDYAYFAPAS